MKTTLVSSAELAAHPQWRVFDCRHELSAPDKGRLDYLAGHIPGALHAHLDRDLSGVKTGKNGRHPLASPAAMQEWLRRCGVRRSDQIVAYDDVTGPFAARLWWMMRWLGHDAVAVLDGGFKAWVREGRPVTQAVPSFAPSDYTVEERPHFVVSTDEVLKNLESREFRLVDARAANRFQGRDETLDPVAGHIPGALNRPSSRNLDAAGRFKPVEELRAELAALLAGTAPRQVVHQCGSGVTACHNLLAMEVAGLRESRVYPGSWSEWCSDAARPIATDP